MFSKSDIEKYFNGEKTGSLFFLWIGIIGIALAIIFFFIIKSNLYKGMAVPIASLCILSAIAGFTVYKRSDYQRIDIVYAYDMNPSKLKEIELPRMKKVMNSFKIIRWIEILFISAGIGLYIYFIRDFRQDFWRGFGFALAVMALMALVADRIAEKRSRIYLKGLESFTSKIS